LRSRFSSRIFRLNGRLAEPSARPAGRSHTARPRPQGPPGCRSCSLSSCAEPPRSHQCRPAPVSNQRISISSYLARVPQEISTSSYLRRGRRPVSTDAAVPHYPAPAARRTERTSVTRHRTGCRWRVHAAPGAWVGHPCSKNRARARKAGPRQRAGNTRAPRATARPTAPAQDQPKPSGIAA
jgi:hypothetical protein